MATRPYQFQINQYLLNNFNNNITILIINKKYYLYILNCSFSRPKKISPKQAGKQQETKWQRNMFCFGCMSLKSTFLHHGQIINSHYCTNHLLFEAKQRFLLLVTSEPSCKRRILDKASTLVTCRPLTIVWRMAYKVYVLTRTQPYRQKYNLHSIFATNKIVIFSPPSIGSGKDHSTTTIHL